MNKSEILAWIKKHKNMGMTVNKLDGLCFGKNNGKGRLYQALYRNKKIPKAVADAVEIQIKSFEI